ncbi:MAG: cupin domain-containing protein, partial [Granulosicoccaceae bacterium]
MQSFDQIQWPDGLTAERFIAEYWQQKPLYIPQAFPGFENPLPADELGGLACDPDVASRLLIESKGERPWELRHGPFEPELFDWLGEDGWALLVGDLDKVLPEFRHWLNPFRFIPDWRIDDLMASFAPPGGSVGPHFDHYDVFLWQVDGTRTWHIGPEPEGGYRLIPGLDIKVIESPQFTQSIAVLPGDLLYLPPGYLHHGVAETPCITWSVGFRAPTASDLANGWTDEATQSLADAAPLRDPAFTAQSNPGEISQDARDRLRHAVAEALANGDTRFDRWLGKHLTDRAADLQLNTDNDGPSLITALACGKASLERRADIRFAYQRIAGSCYLYAGGHEYEVPEKTAASVCQAWQWRAEDLVDL